MKLFLLVIISYLAFQQSAYACLGSFSEKYVFLKSLPITAFDRQNVALVEVVDVKNGMLRETKVKILEPIKNMYKGQNITIKEQMHSCTRPYEIKKDQKYYIAGEIEEDNSFSGSWSGDTHGIW